MKRAFLVVVTAFLLACSADEAPKPLSEAGEKLYTVRGKILSRDAAENTLHMDHEAIPGFMEAMVMDYGVRGAKVAELPADGKRVEARLHVTERAYWITDVRAAP
jgi:protein SCO1/2